MAKLKVKPKSEFWINYDIVVHFLPFLWKQSQRLIQDLSPTSFFFVFPTTTHSVGYVIFACHDICSFITVPIVWLGLQDVGGSKLG